MKMARVISIVTGVVLVLLIAGVSGYYYGKSKEMSNPEENSSEEMLEVVALEPVPPAVTLDFAEQMQEYQKDKTFIDSIEQILEGYTQDYGIYIKDLTTGKEYEINADQTFQPASVSKVPYGLLTLKHIDEGKLTYDTRLTLQNYHKSYTTDPLYSYSAGSTWAVRDLLRLLLVDSDNIPMKMLEEHFGGAESYNQQVADMGAPGLTRNPHETTARNVGAIFEKIYNGELLSQESNQVLTDHLSTYKIFSSDRIRLGVLRAGGDANEVVHKIGNLQGVYHDAGYIKGPKTDFILVTLNQNRTPGQGVGDITQITQEAYHFFNE